MKTSSEIKRILVSNFETSTKNETLTIKCDQDQKYVVFLIIVQKYVVFLIILEFLAKLPSYFPTLKLEICRILAILANVFVVSFLHDKNKSKQAEPLKLNQFFLIRHSTVLQIS